MINVTERQHKMEDAVDYAFDQLINYITANIANDDDKKAIVELLSIMNDGVVTQLSNRGYIDMERVHPNAD